MAPCGFGSAGHVSLVRCSAALASAVEPCGMTLTVWTTRRVSWMCVSTGLVVLNKYLLSTVGFCYPMALSGMGMAFSSVASFIACKVNSAPLPPMHAVASKWPEPRHQEGGLAVPAPACCSADAHRPLANHQTFIDICFDVLLFVPGHAACIPVDLQHA